LTGTAPLVQTLDRLTDELKQKVVAHRQSDPRDQPERATGNR
jgi:hypothetical protein